MQKKINYKEVEVMYYDRGEGACIVFLHGYLEAAEIWSGFVDRFFKRYRILTLDLPGHGQSGIWGKVHSMELSFLHCADQQQAILVYNSLWRP